MAAPLPYHKLSTKSKVAEVIYMLDSHLGGRVSSILDQRQNAALKARLEEIVSNGTSRTQHFNAGKEVLDRIITGTEPLEVHKDQRVIPGLEGKFLPRTLPELKGFTPNERDRWINLLNFIDAHKGTKFEHAPIAPKFKHYVHGYQGKLKEWGALSDKHNFDYEHLAAILKHLEG